ncbi:hypothetical protein LLEC1_01430 [Akanthomyces lecanii]|uniref:Ribosome biogenesis protein SLX9 n=1 Tax=Cordyceps confragosa TaxID=2714763 RepID=A0A179I5G2_CORDF|nr:hypothetical protein LLEC1_01430 [Akanthomyces lecanii]
MKHSSFVSRVADAGIAKKKHKTKRTGRGRSGKQLATTMEGLADALPALEDAPRGKVRHRSISSKKGALRRKEHVVRGEMERFGNSMAQMAATQEERTGRTGTASTEGESAPTSAGASNRWAALRGYISSTMEQNPAFAGRQ